MTKTANIQSNAVTFSGLVKATTLSINLNTPAIFLGTYGIGKSAGVRASVEQAGYCLVDFRAGEIMPEDVGGIGVPRREVYTDGTAEQLVERAVPDIITRCRTAVAKHNKPCVLFLDEITSAVPAVQAALFQVLLDRVAGGTAFPAHTRVIAAGNLATDRSLVEELARPLLNRAMVYNYTGPTYDEYAAYMKAKQFHPIIMTFLKVNEAYICDKIDPDAEQSPTPRALEVASDLLFDPTLDKQFRLIALAASIGGPAAYELEAFIDMESQLTPVDAILSDPASARLPDQDNFAASYMQVYALTDALNRRATAPECMADQRNTMCTAAWTYAKRLNVELGALYLTGINTTVLTALLSRHQNDLQTLHGGAYMDIFTELVAS